MGFNTTVVVMNDSLDAIKNDPDFGRKLYEAILHHTHPADVSAESGRAIHVNAAVVIETHHASYPVLVRVGGNMGEVVSDGSTGEAA